jgi:tetratricopeptide (TPR) repeat protein
MALPVLPSSAASGRRAGGPPVRAGLLPALADGFLPRTETAPGLPSELIPGAVIVLAPASAGTSSPLGKTQVAVAYAHSFHRSGAIVIWADAGSRASIMAGYAAAATELGVDASQGADSAARHLLAALSQPALPWLVVLDGLRDAADAEGLIPSGPAGMTLITAADARLVPDSWRATILPVSPFTAREAMSYLRGRLRSDWDQRAGMINLVTEIGGEPVPLAQASGVIAVSPLSCRQYTDKLVLRRQQMTRADGPAPPVATATLALAVERADQLDAAAWPMLVVAAALDCALVPAPVFDTATVARYATGEPQPDVPALAGTLPLLAELGLACIDPHPTGAVVRFSEPILAAVRGALNRDDHEMALAAAVAGVTEAWPQDEPNVWLGYLLASCSIRLWRAAGDRLWAGSCPLLLQRTGEFLVSAGMLGAALPFWADLSATAERLLEPDHPDALVIAGRVAALHLADGEPARAAVRYERIFRELSGRLGTDDATTIAAQVDLGRSLAADGQFAQAVTVLDQAAAGYERVLGPDHLDTVVAAEQLAEVCVQAGEPARAITLYRRALADRLRLQGPRHLEAIAARQRLAGAYLAAGDIRAAVSEGKKVVADRKRELGEHHLDTLIAIGDLGNALQAGGRTNQALPMLEQARAGHERILGADHRDTLARCADLARAYNAIGWIVDADMLLRDTEERCDRFLPETDPLTAAVRELLASIAGR